VAHGVDEDRRAWFQFGSLAELAGCDGKHEKATIHCKLLALEVSCPSS